MFLSKTAYSYIPTFMFLPMQTQGEHAHREANLISLIHSWNIFREVYATTHHATCIIVIIPVFEKHGIHHCQYSAVSPQRLVPDLISAASVARQLIGPAGTVKRSILKICILDDTQVVHVCTQHESTNA